MALFIIVVLDILITISIIILPHALQIQKPFTNYNIKGTEKTKLNCLRYF